MSAGKRRSQASWVSRKQKAGSGIPACSREKPGNRPPTRYGKVLADRLRSTVKKGQKCSSAAMTKLSQNVLDSRVSEKPFALPEHRRVGPFTIGSFLVAPLPKPYSIASDSNLPEAMNGFSGKPSWTNSFFFCRKRAIAESVTERSGRWLDESAAHRLARQRPYIRKHFHTTQRRSLALRVRYSCCE